MKSEVYNIDCLDFMRGLPDNAFTLAIADPPYGLPALSVQGKGKLRNRILNKSNIRRWDTPPGKEFFDELKRVSENQIIFGGNYFNLGPCRCFVCWDKMQPFPNFSQCELAWTSFNKPAKIFRMRNCRKKIHPTQKPVELYAYILSTFAPNGGGGIFDPMMGSQSSRIAAYKLGYDYVGCEIDTDYFNDGCERFTHECAPSLFE